MLGEGYKAASLSDASSWSNWRKSCSRPSFGGGVGSAFVVSSLLRDITVAGATVPGLTGSSLVSGLCSNEVSDYLSDGNQLTTGSGSVCEDIAKGGR